MSLEDLRDTISDEVSTILSNGFSIEIAQTSTVPHSGDTGITFPNLDEKYQKCKVIKTAVLYIDIRRSTELNLEHKASTVAKLYSSFVRSMTQCARYYNGHVRGIIGDRVMVIFNPSTAFKDAVNTAILMHSVATRIINKHFKQNEVTCGIGIDYGRMLVTKTGIRKNGYENTNYKSLVWLGRPANVASKLTDTANKTHVITNPIVREGHHYDSLNKWGWYEYSYDTFIDHLEVTYSRMLKHKDEYFRAFHKSTSTQTISYPAILMTKAVYDGFKAACPNDKSIKEGWWTKQSVTVSGYSGDVYGGNVYFLAFGD